MKIFSFLSKVVKIGLYLCRVKEMHKNMQKNIINKFANYEKIDYLCGCEKGIKKALHRGTQGQRNLRLIALL